MAQTLGGKVTNANEKDDSPIKEVTTTEVGTKTGLDVNLTSGDIQIGAVEIKDGTTDARAKIKTDGTDNAQVVMANVLPLPAGAATSAKQLADDHNVTANAGTNLNTSALATEATMTADLQAIEDNQTDGTQVTQLISEGVLIGSSLDSDGNNHLSTAMIQDVNVAAGNSSSTNLAAGATWAGTPVSTLGDRKSVV